MRTKTYHLRTGQAGMYDVTERVFEAVEESGIKSGLAVIYCQYTNAGVIISENADANLRNDLMIGLDAAFPDREDFRHFESNTTAHLKSLCTGVSCMVPVEEGRPLLGTWQGVYFCEFEETGSRALDKRSFLVKVMEDITVD